MAATQYTAEEIRGLYSRKQEWISPRTAFAKTGLIYFLMAIAQYGLYFLFYDTTLLDAAHLPAVALVGVAFTLLAPKVGIDNHWGEALVRYIGSVLLACTFIGPLILAYSVFAAFLDSATQRTSRFMNELRPLLPGWNAADIELGDMSRYYRLLTAPNGQRFFIGQAKGTVMYNMNGSYPVCFAQLDQKIRDVAARKGFTDDDVQFVVWVTGVDFAPYLDGGITTIYGDAAEVATHLTRWADMRQNLAEAYTDPSEIGVQAEQDAKQALTDELPLGWTMETNVILAYGGDADILLTRPDGLIFAVDVKSRTDQMDLSADKGDRSKSWQDVHDQVLLAAAQTKATGIVWQSRTRDKGWRNVGRVWNCRGNAAHLIASLNTLQPA